MGRVRSFLKRRALTILFAGVLALVTLAWWQSSRYSERHLIYVGPWTVEVFSASSLLRVSLVRGRVSQLGAKTFYRQPNSRGKFMMRPTVPAFQSRPDMWEITLGYWHLAGISLAGVIGMILVEAKK